jgi:hypothetical protein
MSKLGACRVYFVIPVSLSMLFFAASAATEDKLSGNTPAA